MNGFDMQDPYAAQIQAGVQQQLAQNAARRDPFSPEALGVGQAPMQAPARQGFGQRMTGLLGQIGTGVRNYLSDEENRARLAMAFNTMRLTPDQGLATALQSRIENAQATRLLGQQANRTAQWLRQAGGQLGAKYADYLEQNPTAKVSDILSMYETERKAIIEGSDTETIKTRKAEAAALGFAPGSNEYNEYIAYGGGANLSRDEQVATENQLRTSFRADLNQFDFFTLRDGFETVKSFYS